MGRQEHDDFTNEGVQLPINHELKLTKLELTRAVLLTPVLLPVRLLLFGVLFFLSWVVATVLMLGVDEETCRNRPLHRGWRFLACRIAAFLLRRATNACGLWVKTKGKQAETAEAPLLVVAPHTTFIDPILHFCLVTTLLQRCGFPLTVSREESRNTPFIGTLIKASQAIFVKRESPDSRKKTRELIIERCCNSSQGWPQLLIFPEGSTFNGQALMPFKLGAFCPKKPVQPVLIRYSHNNLTWTWNQSHGCLTILWLVLVYLRTVIEIEFLPVYRPDEAERDDARLFAQNVRATMAEALGVPVFLGTWKEEGVVRERTLNELRAKDKDS